CASSLTWTIVSYTLGRPPFHHQLLDLGDRLGRIEPLRTDFRAVHDRVAAIELERILEVVEPLRLRLVAAVDQPAIGLQQHRRPQVLLAVPPIGRARGRAARAQDTFVEPVELLALRLALQPLRL